MSVAVVIAVASTVLLGIVATLCVRFFLRAKRVEARFGPIVGIEDERVRLIKERDGLTGELDRRRKQFDSELAKERAEHQRAIADQAAKAVSERDTLVGAIKSKREWFEAQMAHSLSELERLQKEVGALEEREELQSFGFYKPHYDLGTPAAYKKRLDQVRDAQAAMLKAKTASLCSQQWQVEGSAAKGKQMTDRYLKLQLRAFNGECDASVAKVRFNNAVALEERMRKSFETINKLGETQKCRIVEKFLDLRVEELRLEHEYAVKVQEEKEEQRRIREQLREEEIAQREIEQAQKEAEKDEKRAEAALEKARAQLGPAFDAQTAEARERIAQLEAELAEAHAKKEQAISRAQLTKSGHVYIISNEGSFGQNVFKVGMTRRLEPMDRIKELGDASVPFGFDLHALIFTEDAPALEARLHRSLDEKRVNLANVRKEFFATSLEEIDAAICGCEIKTELIRDAEAAEYRQTCVMRAARIEQSKARAIAAEQERNPAPSALDALKKTWEPEPAL